MKLRVKTLREDRFLTQDELGKLAGMTRAQISRLENNLVEHPRFSTIKRLAEALGVPPSEIVVRE